MITALVAITTYAQFADGYYRLQCKETGRYLTVHNNYVNKESAKQSGQVYLQSLETISGFDNIVNDPGSIIYLRNTASGYVLESQGFTTGGKNLYLQFTKVDDAYRVWTTITYEGVKYTRYLRDYEQSPGYSYITSDASVSTNWHWYITPLSDDNYFGLFSEIKAGNDLYTTFNAAFPIQLSSGMKAFVVNSLTENSCTLQDIGKIVPKNTPVIIQCAGLESASNKVTVLTSTEVTVSDNKLKGVIFCYPVIVGGKERRTNPAWNCVDYNPATMRIIGVEDEKLCMDTYNELKYVPANSAYLPVTENSAKTIPTDGTTGITRVKNDATKANKANGTFTLNGVRLPDNATPQKGMYIQDGKIVVIKP